MGRKEEKNEGMDGRMDGWVEGWWMDGWAEVTDVLNEEIKGREGKEIWIMGGMFGWKIKNDLYVNESLRLSTWLLLADHVAPPIIYPVSLQTIIFPTAACRTNLDPLASRCTDVTRPSSASRSLVRFCSSSAVAVCSAHTAALMKLRQLIQLVYKVAARRRGILHRELAALYASAEMDSPPAARPSARLGAVICK